jgi:hypothetical protein
MKLEAIMEDKKVPTYIAMLFDEESLEKLRTVSSVLDKPTPASEFHITVIYSKKPTSAKGRGKLDKPVPVKLTKYSVFHTQTGKDCLVIEIESPEITARHEEIMKDYGASYDFDKYAPHITLSYDFTGDIKELPKLETLGDLYCVEEKFEPITEKSLLKLTTAA